MQNTPLLLDHNRLLWQNAGNEEGKQKPKCSIFPLAKDKLQLITDFGTKGNLKHTCSLIANIDTNKENSYWNTSRTEEQPIIYLLMDYISIRHNK